MSAPRTNRLKGSLLSTTVRAGTWPTRARQLNPVFSPFRGCKSRFYAGCQRFSENSCGDTSAGMEVFLEMGGMRSILVACTLRARSPSAPLRGQPATNRCRSLRLHCRQPMLPHSYTVSGTIIGPTPAGQKGRRAEGRIWQGAYGTAINLNSIWHVGTLWITMQYDTLPVPHGIGILKGCTVLFF